MMAGRETKEAGGQVRGLSLYKVDKFRKPTRRNKGNHHENKIRNISFELEENFLSNGKQKKEKSVLESHLKKDSQYKI